MKKNDFWKKKTVSHKAALDKLKPGMRIFLGTGVAEPRTFVKQLMKSDANNLQDLELIQIISFGDAISIKELSYQKYRLKTFFSGWIADEAINSGRVDYIPSRYSEIPYLIESDYISIDVAVIQITPPNESGYSSLGVAVDVARKAIEKASIAIGEINYDIPSTFGDTFVSVENFDILTIAEDEPIYFGTAPEDEIYDKVAANVASIIEDGSCLSFSLGPLFDSLPKHLSTKNNLGIHSPFITNSLMELIKSGAVTNRQKKIYRGKSLFSYALGSKKLFKWIDRNPMIEFQSIETVFSPVLIGKNPGVKTIIHARKVDLRGRVVLHSGKGNIATGPSEVIDFFNGAELSDGGMTIFALSSKNLKGESNIKISIDNFPNQFNSYASIDMVVTEYGVANLRGRSIRERAQAIIEIAHPDERARLIESAKKENIIYKDQIFLEQSRHLYPETLFFRENFKNNTTVRFRPIKPSDEENMRRLFYRFSDQAVYYRYFTPIKAMPHSKMQEYVNVDYSNTISIVGLSSEAGHQKIVAEARFVLNPDTNLGDIAFIVDEQYQNIGIASFLYKTLTKIAKEKNIKGFTADVLTSNKEMLRVFSKGNSNVETKFNGGTYELTIKF